MAEYNSQELPSLHSSSGVTIWRGNDLVHLTNTAYGNITDHLVNVVKGSGGGDPEEVPQRKRLESIVTGSGFGPAQKPVPGWLLGGNHRRRIETENKAKCCRFGLGVKIKCCTRKFWCESVALCT